MSTYTVNLNFWFKLYTPCQLTTLVEIEGANGSRFIFDKYYVSDILSGINRKNHSYMCICCECVGIRCVS